MDRESSLKLGESIEAIYELLLEQKEVQSALLALACQKRDAIVKNDTELVTEIVKKEYLLLSKMNKIELKRAPLMDAACRQLGKPVSEVSFSDLISCAGGGSRPKLETLQAELLDILTRLKAQNAENKGLIEMQLEYTETMLNVFGWSEDPINNFYGTDGRSSSAEVSSGSTLFEVEI